MKSRRLICLGLSCWLLVFSGMPAVAYTLQFSDVSATSAIRWPAATLNISLSSSLSEPQPNIKPGSDVIRAVRRAIKRWSAAARIEIVELNSQAQSVSSSQSGGDGINLITVAPTRENIAVFHGANAFQPARTRVFSDGGGNITEADICLNPAVKFSSDGTFNTFDLESTFTHEIGHMLGLDHSTVMGAVMQPRQAPNGTFYSPQFSGRTLASDDRLGIMALYGSRSGSPRQGSIFGSITLPGGQPVGGVNVWAEDAVSGGVAASAVTRANGSYRLGNLSIGKYRLYASSLDGPIGLSDLESLRGAYLAPGTKSPVIRTRELGQVQVTSEIASVVNAEISTEPSDFTLSLAGLNNQASSVAVPLVAGSTYTIYVGGRGVIAENIVRESIESSSPFIHVDTSSVAQEYFGHGVDVISVQIKVDSNAPDGAYSLFMKSRAGSLGCLIGAFVVSQGIDESSASELDPDGLDAPAEGNGLGSLILSPRSQSTFQGDGETEEANGNALVRTIS